MEPTDDASFEMATPRTMPMLDPTVHAHEPLPAAAAPRKGKQVVHVLPQGYRTVVDPSAFDGGRVGEAVISKVVPGEGPLHGGVDVTVLGTGFHNGLTVLFGSTPATATQYWNSNTLVVILPPGTTPGPVVVSFKDQQGVVANGDRPLPIFVYKDESERTLMELALQVVGLRLNGRIEDAREVAMRIVGEAAAGSNGSAPTGISPGSISSATLNLAMAFAGRNPMTKDEFEELLLDVFGKARHKARYLLTVNRRGLSLLHLAVLADMPRLVSWLSDEVGGMLVDAADDAVGGWTALMWASWLGRSECAEALLNAGADGFLCDESGRSAWDLAVERGWDTVIDLLEIHGLDETEDEFEASGSEWGDEYESDWASESEYSYSEDGSSIYSEDANEHEADEVQTTMVLPIMAIGAEADVQPAPPGEIPAAPIPLPLANNPSASPIIRPASAARPLEVLEETVLGGPAQTEEEELVVDAVPMEPAGPLPLPPQLARTMQWFHSLTSIGSAVQSIDVGDVARYPFTNMQNPFRHFEIPNAVSGLFRRKAAVKTGEEEKEGEAMAMGAIGVVDAGKNQQQEVAPVSLSVVSWVGQSSGRKAAKGSGSQAADGNGKQVAPVASQRDDVEAEAAPTGAAFTAVVTDDDKAVQGQDYTTLLWFWLPMAVCGCFVGTLSLICSPC